MKGVALQQLSSGGSGGASVAHAELWLFHGEYAEGGAKLGASMGSIPFQFNPKEVSITKSAKWERKPVKKSTKGGPPEFKGSDPCKLTLEMFFDATEKHEATVVESVEKLLGCCVPTDDTVSKDKPLPPLVQFVWGGLTSFPAFVTSVTAKYTLFSANGMPIRALCSVALEEMPGEPKQQNPTSGSLATQRLHTTVSGDTLGLIAYREYGDSALWRPLAAFNGIDDPMRIAPGTPLVLPAVEDLFAGVG